jgi:hypothetical protein
VIDHLAPCIASDTLLRRSRRWHRETCVGNFGRGGGCSPARRGRQGIARCRATIGA